jgi:hypothetical protein
MNSMFKKCVLLGGLSLGMLLVPRIADAQILDIISIINAAIKRVIVAADLEVERLQLQTIGLQETQKELENAMQDTELGDIAGWVQQQKDLFSEFYQELWKVKNAISTYEQVKEMIARQAQIVAGYKQIAATIGKDRHFSADELSHMYNVLGGILRESVQNLNRLELVIKAFVTQMADADRLRIVDEAAGGIDSNYRDLQQFSQQSILLSLQRSKDEGDIAVTKALYGIP